MGGTAPARTPARKLVFPSAIVGKERSETIIGELCYHRDVEFAPINDAIVYDVEYKDNQKDQPMCNIRIGWRERYRGVSHNLQVIAQGVQVIEALQAMKLVRGDRIGLAVRAEDGPDGRQGGHIVNEGYVYPDGTKTQSYACSNLEQTNGLPNLTRFGHTDALPAPMFQRPADKAAMGPSAPMGDGNEYETEQAPANAGAIAA